METLNWNDLPLFLAIAEAGSLNGAARKLGINHSTVFRRLNALEADLNARLFERQPDGYLLTPTGERMRELARAADESISTIARELAGRDLAPTGRVRLTTAPNLARTIVPKAIRWLRERNPGIVVDVAVSDDDYDLSRREADIALRATPKPPDHFVGKRLMNLSWRICAGKRMRRRPGSEDELAGFDLIGAEKALLRLDAFQSLESRFAERIVCRASDLSTMAAMAVEGIGLALLPSDQQEPELRPLFDYGDFGGELWLLTHPDMRGQARVKAVWDAIDAVVAQRAPA